MVVDRHGQDLLRLLLPDDVLVEESLDLLWLGQFAQGGDARLCGVLPPLRLVLEDHVAEMDALVADVHPGTGDELGDLILTFPAKRTANSASLSVAITVFVLKHVSTSVSPPAGGGIIGHSTP